MKSFARTVAGKTVLFIVSVLLIIIMTACVIGFAFLLDQSFYSEDEISLFVNYSGINVRGRAFVEGRNYVLPEDIQAVSGSVLAHRLLLNGKARMSHVTAEDVVEEIVKKVAVPKL